jgi:hypothetical protein
VNGTTITRQDGGFVEYYQLLFDAHQVIYAEGIAAETLLLDERTRPALPEDLASTLQDSGLRHSADLLREYEVEESLLDRDTDMATLLKRATTG